MISEPLQPYPEQFGEEKFCQRLKRAFSGRRKWLTIVRRVLRSSRPGSEFWGPWIPN